MGLTPSGLFAWVVLAGGVAGAVINLYALVRAVGTWADLRADAVGLADPRDRIARGDVRRHAIRLGKQAVIMGIGLSFALDPLPVLPNDVRPAFIVLTGGLVLISVACMIDAALDLATEIDLGHAMRVITPVPGGRRAYDLTPEGGPRPAAGAERRAR